MLTFLGLLILVMLSTGFGAWGMKTYLEATSSAREAVLRHELAALRAVQSLNLEGWKARQSLHDIASEGRPDNPSSPRFG